MGYIFHMKNISYHEEPLIGVDVNYKNNSIRIIFIDVPR